MEDMAAGRRMDLIALRVHRVVADRTLQIHSASFDGAGLIEESYAKL